MGFEALTAVAPQAVQASLAATAAVEAAQYQLTYVIEGPDGTRSRFSLGGPASLAVLVAGAAGCSSPHPDGLARTDAQQAPAPQVRSQYYESQVVVMDRMREEGHHNDQALFGLVVGALLLVTVVSNVISFLLGRRSGRKSAERAALRPPPSSGSSGPGFMRGIGE